MNQHTYTKALAMSSYQVFGKSIKAQCMQLVQDMLVKDMDCSKVGITHMH